MSRELPTSDRPGQMIEVEHRGRHQLWSAAPGPGYWWAVPVNGGKAIRVKREPAKAGGKPGAWTQR